MASRRLKVFQTHIGFHDLVVAAPSMKAAAQAWGSSPRIFARGFAQIAQDADAVVSALAHPGTVLRRHHGQAGQYKVGTRFSARNQGQIFCAHVPKRSLVQSVKFRRDGCMPLSKKASNKIAHIS